MGHFEEYKTKDITNPKVTDYINMYYSPCESLRELRRQSEEEGVPVITRETEEFLRFQLGMIKPKRILEIGCAVGYSAMFFSEISGAEVFTVEKDHCTYLKAVENVKILGFSDRVHVYEGDGEEVTKSLLEAGEKDFDLVFIDAAKSHYRRFFDAALLVAKADALFIGDNVLFQAKVASDEYDPGRKHKTNVRKMREFNEYICRDSRFESVILAIGDGISLTRLVK